MERVRLMKKHLRNVVVRRVNHLFAMRCAALMISVLLWTLGLSAAGAGEDNWPGCDDQNIDAIAACSALIASGKLSGHDLAVAYYRRGLARARREDEANAVADFNQAIQIDATYTDAYHNRGISLRQMGNADSAIVDFDQTIRLDPKSFRYLVRGDTWKLKGDIERARADYNAALTKMTTDPTELKVQQSARDRLATLSRDGLAASYKANRLACLAADGNDVIAIENGVAIGFRAVSMIWDCSGLIASGKLSGHDLAVAYYRRGLARKITGYLDGAVADFDQTIRLDPKNVQAYMNKGRAHQLKGDLTSAIADWDQVVRFESDNVEAYVLRGIAFQAKGYTGAAARDYDRAISLDPDNPVAHYNRGSIWESTGDIDRARADYNAALRMAARNPDAFKAQRSAHDRLGALPKEEKIAERPVVLSPSSRLRVPLKAVGGTFVVPVEINGAISLDFVIDSGASDVSIPADVVSTLIRTGTIEKSDFIGKQAYVLADGSRSPSDVFTIRSLKVGVSVIENVQGSIAPAAGSLLLGQSFLQRFKSWSIDNLNHELLLESRQK